MRITPTLVEQLLSPLPLVIGYAFWLTYRDPARTRLTRLLHQSVEATKFPPLGTSAATLAIAVVCLLVGFASMFVAVLGL